ncbi:hypothetical protein SAMN05421686_101115 [Thalassolituus maritimus]|uniref:Uncharacterized protein n=1 Tax=Thalassolituus maritimus TaxID=484498 RepID=A0A1N7IXY5_9GAMM|nr:hypothetical protein [Thalassolituus maritimus]SIS41861.1 hypothetical protein SAMN05421686_101115 [Thalassolituus maritimus]
MSSDQDTIQKAETDLRREKDLDDYHNELMGNDVGRIQRFGFEHGRQEAAADEKRKKSAFEQMMFNEVYRAAWESAMDAVNRAENAVYEALIQASYDLSAAETSYNDLLKQATTTTDGTKVFCDKDGNVYTEDGEPLPAEIAESLVWDDNAPTWEEYSASKENLTNAQSRYGEVNAKSGRLVEIREELTDENNPASIERIHELTQDALDLQESLDNEVRKETSLEQSMKPVIAPDLSFSF